MIPSSTIVYCPGVMVRSLDLIDSDGVVASYTAGERVVFSLDPKDTDRLRVLVVSLDDESKPIRVIYADDVQSLVEQVGITAVRGLVDRGLRSLDVVIHMRGGEVFMGYHHARKSMSQALVSRDRLESIAAELARVGQ